ncbi:elongation factor G [Algihabitans albus]|uniref:elongation factor G n=1 Tax=Algihabitans albus TaxID=2164067 RepID=UPI000E5C9AC9|nr:elongation factor G [Algihabitans albus]
MTKSQQGAARCAVLVGPYGSGKTSLLEALLFAAGTTDRKGLVGDASAEAKARSMSVEPNVAGATYLEDVWSFIDCPGSVELAQDAQDALIAADVAVVVAEPQAAKAQALVPLMKFLDDRQIPHLLFVNKMDKLSQADGERVRDLLAAFQATSSRPLVLRQVPMREGGAVAGAVDLVSERAWHYKPHAPSDLVEIPGDLRDREVEARQTLLETLADFNDDLLEQLLEDKVPANDEVYRHLKANLAADRIVPVFLGSAEQDNGIRRLLKALRHETPGPEAAAGRLGVAPKAEQSGKTGGSEVCAAVARTLNLAHAGKVSVARLLRGSLKEGDRLAGQRLAALFRLQGTQLEKVSSAKAGDLIGLGKLEGIATGNLVCSESAAAADWADPLPPVYALAIQPRKRSDEVKLSAALAKLLEEDRALSLQADRDTGETKLWGQGEVHLRIALDKLSGRFNVEVDAELPQPAYKETIRHGADHHARHKRQTGGHGQFADVRISIAPQPRGAGFAFHDKIVGGAIPKQFIPAVEAGVLDGLRNGPLGFPVVDVAVNLNDGQFHSVDSSEMAFKTAGRIAIQDGLPDCQPVLLEPIHRVVVSVPNAHTSKIHGLLSSRRGQILGFDAKPAWDSWDEVQAYLPAAELRDLIVELRSVTQGIGSFTASFDHLSELTGRLADRVVQGRQAAQ